MNTREMLLATAENAPELPREVQQLIVDHAGKDQGLLAALVCRTDLDDDLRDLVLSLGRVDVTVAYLTSDAASATERVAAASDRRVAVRRALAECLHQPDEMYETLAGSTFDETVHRRLVDNPTTPPWVIVDATVALLSHGVEVNLTFGSAGSWTMQSRAVMRYPDRHDDLVAAAVDGHGPALAAKWFGALPALSEQRWAQLLNQVQTSAPHVTNAWVELASSPHATPSLIRQMGETAEAAPRANRNPTEQYIRDRLVKGIAPGSNNATIWKKSEPDLPDLSTIDNGPVGERVRACWQASSAYQLTAALGELVSLDTVAPDTVTAVVDMLGTAPGKTAVRFDADAVLAAIPTSASDQLRAALVVRLDASRIREHEQLAHDPAVFIEAAARATLARRRDLVEGDLLDAVIEHGLLGLLPRRSLASDQARAAAGVWAAQQFAGHRSAWQLFARLLDDNRDEPLEETARTAVQLDTAS